MKLMSFTLAVLASVGSATLHAQTSSAAPQASPAPAGRAASPVREDAAVIAATREYERSGRARVLQVGTYLVYPYGQTQPRLTCAPLRACTIQLEEGERAPAGMAELKPYTGDQERWFIGTTPGPRNTTLVVIQPSDCDLTTNLTIPTDRRIYHLTLDSPRCTAKDTAGQNPDLPYTRTLRFYYPEDLIRRLAADEDARARAAEAEHQAEAPVPAQAFDAGSLDFGYFSCRDRGYPWRPEQVFADAEHTYVRLPAAAARYETPVLYEIAPSGDLALINYAVRGGYFIADRVLQRGVLVVGRGAGGEQRLLITKDRKDCPR